MKESINLLQGPGTFLEQKIRDKVAPKNALDALCFEHDVFYDKHSDVSDRHVADRQLAEGAEKLARSSEIDWKQRLASYLVAKVMRGKLLIGMGAKSPKKNKKKNVNQIETGRGQLKFNNKAFRAILKKTKETLKKSNPLSEIEAIKLSLKTAKKLTKREKKKGPIILPRIIPVPQKGGFLAILPILSAITAISAAFGGITNIIKNIGEIKEMWKRHVEAKKQKTDLPPSQIGNGMKIGKYKKGLAIHFL